MILLNKISGPFKNELWIQHTRILIGLHIQINYMNLSQYVSLPTFDKRLYSYIKTQKHIL